MKEILHTIKGISQNKDVRRVGRSAFVVGTPVLALAAIFGGSRNVTATEATPTVVREATPTETFHTVTPVPSETPLPTREATPTVTFHTVTPVPGTQTPEATPTDVPHTATPVATATGTRVPETATPTATATATPKVEIVTRIIYTGLKFGESLQITQQETNSLARENEVATIDFLRDGMPLFGGDVQVAPPAISDLKWNRQVVARGIETYAFPEDPEIFGQIDTGDSNRLLFAIHESLGENPRPDVTPLGAKFSEVKVGDTAGLVISGEFREYKVTFSGIVDDLDARLNAIGNNPSASFVTCEAGVNPLLNPGRRYLITAEIVPVPEVISIPLLGEVSREDAAKGLAAAVTLAASAALISLEAKRRKDRSKSIYVS
ncbi:MAG: hypothetical protein Q8P25_04245 [Candidatus Curtissbacteria bacterium]|nr:hypothetical protein [Candidatus Curtissbacteria bacterium]